MLAVAQVCPLEIPLHSTDGEAVRIEDADLQGNIAYDRRPFGPFAQIEMLRIALISLA